MGHSFTNRTPILSSEFRFNQHVYRDFRKKKNFREIYQLKLLIKLDKMLNSLVLKIHYLRLK